MKRFALAAALALTVSGTVHATTIEVVLNPHPEAGQPPALPFASGPHNRVADLAVAPRFAVVTPPTGMSELPEPDVFAMMLVGLVLIGYRARRDSDEKFK